MIVGIDVSVVGAQALSGVGFHIIRLLESMHEQADSTISFRLFYESSEAQSELRIKQRLGHLNKMPLIKIPFFKTNLGKLHSFKSKVWIPFLVGRHKCDVFHGPAHQIPLGLKIPSVVTIHDMAVFRHDLYDPAFNNALRGAMRRSIENSNAVISLSEYTQSEVTAITGRENDLHVIYGAGNYASKEAREIQPSDKERLGELGINGNYVFYVGDFGTRKNIPYLIEGYSEFKKFPDTDNVQLVLAGNSKNAQESLNKVISENGLQNGDVVFPGRVSDEDLVILYRNASAFALASLGEGFTLVTLEAMSYGIPVVATNTTSITEGTGNAAELVPLDNSKTFAQGLQKAISSPQRQEMIESGLKRVQLFSWKENGRKTIELYKSLA